jgi:formylmethanofuran dehydrogenase subunit E
MENNPKFFDDVEKISMSEPLGGFLGSENVSVFSFGDVVKLSGHSCPTVAGAYLMTLYALKALHNNDELPIRGNIKVEMRGKKGESVVGVIANVASFITGAKEEDGFKGLGGIFSRNNLLFFGAKIQGEMKFTRLDTKKSVEVSYDISNLPLSDFDGNLMQKALMNKATKEESELFGKQWQKRVSEILLVHKDKAVIVRP